MLLPRAVSVLSISNIYRDSPRESHSKRESELFGKDKYDRENKENVPYTESLRGSILERKERKRCVNL